MSPADAADARGRLIALIRGDTGWDADDIIRLDALTRLGRPAEVVTNLPPVVIAKGDNWGGRMGTREGEVAADVLQAWRGVGALCGRPLPAPHDCAKGGTQTSGR